MRHLPIWLGLAFLCAGHCRAAQEVQLPIAAQTALTRGVEFFSQQVATHGGYVYRYSADLAKREGEGQTTRDTVWVQPPGTPAVGAALVRAYERTGDPNCLAAAQAAAECLLQGQYRSGGWNASVEFAPAERAKHAYRVDPPLPKKRQRNTSSLDDDKTQSTLRFLMSLDRALKFQDERLHEATMFALDQLLEAQFPNGAWAQVWEGPADQTLPRDLKASYPDDWPRKYPGGDYWKFYTFNDNNISETIDMLWLAEEIYGGGRYREAILKAGQFIIDAQLPEPQPAWAQQYDFEMHPVWARKFEPPAVSGGESQRLIGTLLDLYTATRDRKFLDPVPAALAYLQRSQLPDGRLARFYELQTNRPLYLTRTYELTYSDDDLPTHYGFQVSSGVERLEERYRKLKLLSAVDGALLKDAAAQRVRLTRRMEVDVRRIVDTQDERGAWVEEGRLQYHGKGDDTRRIIASETFIRNLDALSSYLQVTRAGR